MRISSLTLTFSILLVMLGSVRAQGTWFATEVHPAAMSDVCPMYDEKNTHDTTHWYDVAPLAAGMVDDNVHLKRSATMSVTITGRKGFLGIRHPTHHFDYTFSTDGSYDKEKKSGTIEIHCVRSDYGGEDQQFKVTFHKFNLGQDNILASRWIKPNQKCTTEVDFDPTTVTSVTVEHRDWNRDD